MTETPIPENRDEPDEYCPECGFLISLHGGAIRPKEEPTDVVFHPTEAEARAAYGDR